MSINYGPGGLNGSSAALAAPSAISILKANPGASDGIYWIKKPGFNSGVATQVYCDMTTDGGGWVLLVCNSAINGSTKMNHTNYSLLNQASPSITQSYSILSLADGLKSANKKFQYMMDAGVRRQLGGIWTANQPSYSFTQTVNTATNITLNTKFGNWSYSENGIEARMPWVNATATSSGKLTTSTFSDSSWWGTIIEASSSFSPAPWMNADGFSNGTGFVGASNNPGIIWYWMRPL